MAFLPGPTNFVNDMLYSNCQRPFYIYVLTAIPAFIDAVVALRLFDFDDLVRARASQLSKGGATPGRSFKHGRNFLVNERPKSAPHRGYKMGLKHLLAITQPLEHIGWALLLYGVVNKFYFDWAMYLDDADACLQPSFYGPLIRKVDDSSCFPTESGNTIQLPVEVSNPAFWPANNFDCTLPLGRYTAVFAATVVGPANGASYQLELRFNRGFGIDSELSEPVFCAPGTPTDIIVTLDVLFPLVTGGTILWAIRGPAVPVGLQVVKADVFIMRRETAFES